MKIKLELQELTQPPFFYYDLYLDDHWFAELWLCSRTRYYADFSDCLLLQDQPESQELIDLSKKLKTCADVIEKLNEGDFRGMEVVE